MYCKTKYSDKFFERGICYKKMNFIYFFLLLSIILSGIEYILSPFAIFDFTLILLIEYATIEKNLNRGLIIVTLMGLIQDVSIGSILGFNIFFKSFIF